MPSSTAAVYMMKLATACNTIPLPPQTSEVFKTSEVLSFPRSSVGMSLLTLQRPVEVSSASPGFDLRRGKRFFAPTILSSSNIYATNLLDLSELSSPQRREVRDFFQFLLTRRTTVKKADVSYKFSDLCGTMNWKGDAVAAQRNLRDEW